MNEGEKILSGLTRRERQIMEIVYAKGRVTANEVLENLKDQPTYSAVRASLSGLEKKGLLKHQQISHRYVFEPTLQPDKVRKSALANLVRTFFQDSVAQVVSTLVSSKELKVDDETLDHLEKIIKEAKKARR